MRISDWSSDVCSSDLMAEKQDILAAHPDGQRRFYEMKGGGYSNCNLFWLGSEAALKATESFREGGQFAKHPSRIVKAFGILNLIRFRFGLTTLEGIFQIGRASCRERVGQYV